MAFTERDRAALEEGLRRLSEHNDELLRRGLDKLGQMGSSLRPGPPDRYWPTTLALFTAHEQQRRAIGAAFGALNRLTRRLGTDGVSRYPDSEWGEPLALATWKRVGGRPRTLGRDDPTLAGPSAELCPSCGVRHLTPGLRARGSGQRRELRLFGECRDCKFAVDLTDGSTHREAVEEERQPKRAASQAAPATPAASTTGPRNDGKPYFDEQVDGWCRDTGGPFPAHVAGEDDLSPLHPSKSTMAGCWACGVAPHSRAYHDEQIAGYLAEHGIRRIEEDGQLRIETPDASARFPDESAQ